MGIFAQFYSYKTFNYGIMKDSGAKREETPHVFLLTSLTPVGQFFIRNYEQKVMGFSLDRVNIVDVSCYMVFRV